jgi:hypothetical protein
LDAQPSEPSSSSLSPDNEKMNKRVRWTHESFQALIIIELRVQYDKKFKSTFIKKETVWKELAEDIKNKGFNVSSKQCHDNDDI